MTTVWTPTPVVMNNVAQSVAPAMPRVEARPSVPQSSTRPPVPVLQVSRAIHSSHVGRLTADQTETVPVTRPVTTTTASHPVPLRTPVWAWQSVQWLATSQTVNVLQDLKAVKAPVVPGSSWDVDLTVNVPASWPVLTRTVPSLVTWRIPVAEMPSVQSWTRSLSGPWSVFVSLDIRAMLLWSVHLYQLVLLAEVSSSMRERSVSVPQATTPMMKESVSDVQLSSGLFSLATSASVTPAEVLSSHQMAPSVSVHQDSSWVQMEFVNQIWNVEWMMTVLTSSIVNRPTTRVETHVSSGRVEQTPMEHLEVTDVPANVLKVTRETHTMVAVSIYLIQLRWECPLCVHICLSLNQALSM